MTPNPPTPVERSQQLFTQAFSGYRPAGLISVPGRVNLIGEHIDYHELTVLPMAINRSVVLTFCARDDASLYACSEGYEPRSLDLNESFGSINRQAGDWGNYLEAAILAARRRWELARGLNAAVASDLPLAAGLSSSSALLTGFVLALLQVNGVRPTAGELMEILPDGEQHVGTRGGGMDHAAVLASQPGTALQVRFAPFSAEPVPIPEGWSFLVAHSLVVAEKSGALKAEYNLRRTWAANALKALSLPDYTTARQDMDGNLVDLPEHERSAFEHVTGEKQRVTAAVEALRSNNIQAFGSLLGQSHCSLRDLLKVSHPALDELVVAAGKAGAVGARLTGAGFGGCAVILCHRSERPQVADRLATSFYRDRREFNAREHLIFAEPSAGALHV